jgi:hypothetical protein
LLTDFWIEIDWFFFYIHIYESLILKKWNKLRSYSTEDQKPWIYTFVIWISYIDYLRHFKHKEMQKILRNIFCHYLNNYSGKTEQGNLCLMDYKSLKNISISVLSKNLNGVPSSISRNSVNMSTTSVFFTVLFIVSKLFWWVLF